MTNKTIKTQKANPINKQALIPDSQPHVIKIMCLFLGLIVLHALFLFLANNSDHSEYNWITRIWGFDHISFYPGYIIFITYLIVVLICIPLINNKVVEFFSAGFWTDLFMKLKKYKYIVFVVLSIVAGLIFYYFRIKYHFLGDMDIRVKQTIDKQYINSEYLTMYLLNLLCSFMLKKFEFTGYDTFVLQSVIAGALFVFFAFLISDLTGKSLLEKVVTFLFFISIGAILLFFGYIEIYSIPSLSIVIYIYFALLWIYKKTNFILPLIALLLAIAFHLMSVGMIPSFFIILYQKMKNKIPLLNKIKTKPFLIFILIMLPVIYELALVFQLTEIMPLSKNEQFPDVMTLLSMKHIWEFLNSQILAAGLGLFCLTYFTIKGMRGKLKFDNVMWFYSSAAFFMVFIAFIMNTKRGSGDWDICAIPALIYSPFIAYCFFRDVQSTKQIKNFNYTLLVIIVLNFANTLPWIGINASDKSIKKIAVMLENDPGGYYITRLPSLSLLALSYSANGLKEESLKYFEKTYKKYNKDPRSYYNYASQLIDAGKELEAAKVLNNLIQLAPYISKTYPLLFNIYQKNKMNENIYSTIDFLYSNYKTNPTAYLSNFDKKELLNYFNYLMQVEVQNKNIEKARNISETLKQLQPI
jgi:hypothetical protein